MLRKLVLTVLLLLTVPTLAGAYNYWSITASTSPTIAGAITPPPNDASYSTTGATTNVTSATVTSADFTVNATPAGYVLSYVQIDGVVATPIAANTYRVIKGTRINHSISAVYQTQKYTITTSASANGIIDPTVQVASGSAKTINIYANSGYQIDTLTVTGGPAPSGYAGQTTFSYTFDNIQSNKSISVTFTVIPVLIARITTSPQTILVGAPLTIDGTASTATVPALFTWTITDPATGGPKTGASITTGSSTAQFSATAIGSYRVNLALSNPLTATSTAQVDIGVITQSQQDSNNCTACHAARNPAIVAAYGSSPHAASVAKEVSCYSCHFPPNAPPHPGIIQPYDSCNSCHLDGAGNVPGHLFAVADGCVTCHDAHATTAVVASIQGAPHYGNISTALYAASYVTSQTSCSACHYNSTANSDIRQQWYSTGHAKVSARAWNDYDFKTMNGCVQCHSTTGFIAYSSGRVTAAWGVASDQTREVLSCKGCHTDVSAGTLRSTVPVRPYAGDSYANPDLGTASNLCLRCHAGTQSGRSIKAQAAANADFTGLPFISSHSSAAGGILFGTIGYQFGTRDYRNSHFKHDRIGINHYKAYGFDTGSAGPCVGCHMTSANKHTFSPLAKDAAGSATAIASTSCAGCHTGAAYLDAGRANSRIGKYAATLLALQKVLESKGFYYADAAPYFFKSAGDTSPGNAVTNWGNADTMGAAFNFNLLQHEKGAYAHNMIYTKRLIYDSIDFLDNGVLDNSAIAAINALPSLNATQKAAAIGYLAPAGARP